MNTYKFIWLKPESRSDKRIMLSATEEWVQNAAESILGRILTTTELALIPGLFAEKIEFLSEGKDSLFADVVKESVMVSTIFQELRTSGGGVRK